MRLPRPLPLTSLALLVWTSALTGCAVVEVAGAATGAVISVGAAVVSTGVEVTGKVVGATVDAATGSSDKTP